MPWDNVEAALEAATAALNACLCDEEAGLPVAPEAYAAPAAALSGLYAQLLAGGPEAYRLFAIEGQAEVRRLGHDQAVYAALDTYRPAVKLTVDGQPLTWRNWKSYERACAGSATALQAGFDEVVAHSVHATPALEARIEQARADYGAYGLTPVHTFAAREGLGVPELRALLVRVGQAGQAAFKAAADRLSGQVFGRSAGPAELRGLYLNLMYAPGAPMFTAEAAVPEALAAFRRLGFALEAVTVDVEDRPRKYPGAFCWPVRVPGDVRVSVRTATAHHLVDMLYHELGHAVHFSGIDAGRSFLDRYWIASGTHEVFSTLFEWLLAEPLFLEEQFGLNAAEVDQLLEFAAFKRLLTGAWLGAAALTVLDAWLEAQPWPVVEAAFAANMLAFTGVALPAGFARLEPFTAALSIYPAGYVLAEARLGHWLEHWRAQGGAAWWRSPAVVADIRAHVRAGGAVRWPAAWNEPPAAAGNPAARAP
ncbi:MAG: hypothetical protein IT317_08775 [Anaerolineales bacterium]|nr:hypothetical protein [Anaerolineales bacterium]